MHFWEIPDTDSVYEFDFEAQTLTRIVKGKNDNAAMEEKMSILFSRVGYKVIHEGGKP